MFNDEEWLPRFFLLLLFGLGVVVMYLLRNIPIVGPIIGGICIGLLLRRGMLIGLILGATGGVLIGIFYAHISGILVTLPKYDISPHWDKWGFLGTIMSRGPISTILYFVILGAIGGSIGGFISEILAKRLR